jgi:hypothetical protein
MVIEALWYSKRGAAESDLMKYLFHMVSMHCLHNWAVVDC